MSYFKYHTIQEWKNDKKKRNKFPSAFEIARSEAKAVQELHFNARLPQNEIVAEQMIKGVSFKIKVKAFFYALFWLFFVPAVPAGIASLISILCGSDTFLTVAWFVVIFAPLFFFFGLLGNVQKRLYVSYCLGFRGVKAALTMGWDGSEYVPSYGPTPDYFTQRYRLKMFRKH